MILGIVILVFSFIILFHDWARYGRISKRLILLELSGFLIISLSVIYPNQLNLLAKAFQVGRGVDFLIYPALVWLFRESLIQRAKLINMKKEFTELIRQIALSEADREQNK